MKLTSIQLPLELSNYRVFYFILYFNKTYKNVTLELDDNDERVISFECVCRKNTINDSMNKKQIRCRHIKECIKLLKAIGYLKLEDI